MLGSLPLLFQNVYAKTRFRVENSEAFTRFTEGGDFAIISAYATTGETWSDAENQEADQRLRALLADYTPVRITGYDPAGTHAEPSWAVRIPLEDAIRIGGEFKQVAIFYIEDGMLSIHASMDDLCPPHEVGEFGARLCKPYE